MFTNLLNKIKTSRAAQYVAGRPVLKAVVYTVAIAAVAALTLLGTRALTGVISGLMAGLSSTVTDVAEDTADVVSELFA